MAKLLACFGLALTACTPVYGPDLRDQFTAELAAVEQVTGAGCGDVHVYVLETAAYEAAREAEGVESSAGWYDSSGYMVLHYGPAYAVRETAAHEYMHCAIGENQHGGRFYELLHQAYLVMPDWRAANQDTIKVALK